jgi:hypothetical protein
VPNARTLSARAAIDPQALIDDFCLAESRGTIQCGLPGWIVVPDLNAHVKLDRSNTSAVPYNAHYCCIGQADLYFVQER